MNKKELFQEFEQEFNKMKSELKFNSTLEELEDIFFMKDAVLRDNFISPYLSRAVCRRISDLYSNWVNYLHSIVMPNPGSLINTTEHHCFDEEERKNMILLINKMIAFTSQNTVIGLTKDKKTEGEFIDNSVKLWKELKPELLKISEKTNKNWKEKSNNPQ